MPLVDQPFGETFVFSRARAASYLNAQGQRAAAAVDQPRFDHSPAGAPRGLLIEGRPEVTQADRITVVDGDWAVRQGTVLHEIETPAGVIERRAWYSEASPAEVVDGCLNAKGWHRRIAFVPTQLPNRGGFVRWGNHFWNLGGVMLVEPAVALGVAGDVPLLEG